MDNFDRQDTSHLWQWGIHVQLAEGNLDCSRDLEEHTVPVEVRQSLDWDLLAEARRLEDPTVFCLLRLHSSIFDFVDPTAVSSREGDVDPMAGHYDLEMAGRTVVAVGEEVAGYTAVAAGAEAAGRTVVKVVADSRNQLDLGSLRHLAI